MTAAALIAVLAALDAAYAMRLLADAARDKRAKTEAENKRQHDERMALMPAGGDQ